MYERGDILVSLYRSNGGMMEYPVEIKKGFARFFTG